MKNFSQFIYETGTGSGTYSGAAAQETGERRSEELRKKLQSINLRRKQQVNKKTVIKKYGDTVQKKPESKKPEGKKPEAISGTPKRKALPPAK